MRSIRRIFVHCTASSQDATPEDLMAEFRRKGWRKPGYHYVVDRRGRTYQLCPDAVVANGVYGYNAKSIHVAYIGGIDDRRMPVDNRTPEQRQALVELLTGLRRRYPNAHILGHRDISPDHNHNGIVDPWERIKECPCFDAITEYQSINAL